MAEIIKVYRQAVPQMLFIGKKYSEPGISHWEEWFNNGWFSVIENAMGGENKVHELYEDGDAYIGMMRFKPDDGSLEYWIGEFVSPETTVPEGFLSLALPSVNLGVCWIYGPVYELFGKDYECYQKLNEAGLEIIAEPDGAIWSFERRGCPRMTSPDEKDNYILDYCYFVK
jgi:hypothetical protein